MTGPRPVGRPALARPAIHPSTPATGWCTDCKAWTRQTVDLLLLTADGVSPVGTWTWCEIHDDPDSPLPPRRIDRG
ncbi:hypothetical protein [Streptomyces cinereoruber]|uniref:hypothetical protein n=1 Tax=Streptomyces cinereoruber TaxID=67260 RepID=UPI00363E9974